MENIVKYLDDELTVSNVKISKLIEEFTKLDDISKELIDQKTSIINETLILKSKCNFLKKEIEIRKIYLEDIMKKQKSTNEDIKRVKNSYIHELTSAVENSINLINSMKNLDLVNFTEDIMYIYN